MSYPSVSGHLNEMGVSLETASEDQLHDALLTAFQEDLPLGFARVCELVERFRAGNERRGQLELHPLSEEGKQLARLLGADVARRVLERHFAVSFGFYNCCRALVAGNRDDLAMSLREQIACQDPAMVHC
ncbi:MAG: hypothetical protein WDZ79_02665 [Candidatus Paceibacterota bacterium]